METRQPDWISATEEHQAMDVDKPTASLKKILEAKAVRVAKQSTEK